MTIYCSRCGKEIPENAKFCPYCGEEVILNRNNPDAIEITKEDLEKQQAEQAAQQEKVEEPAYEAPRAHRPYYSDEEINRFKREIEECKRKRKSMVTTGIVITAISFVTLLVLIVLAAIRGYEIGYAAGTSGGSVDIYSLIESDKLIYTYTMLSSLMSIVLDAGVLLIILGAVVNGTKIKNRVRIIEQNRGE